MENQTFTLYVELNPDSKQLERFATKFRTLTSLLLPITAV
jgi:hypothetical protein